MFLQKEIKKKTIICIAPDNWHGLWRNRHYIMTNLSKYYNVFFVNNPRNYELPYFKDIFYKLFFFKKNSIEVKVLPIFPDKVSVRFYVR